MRTRDPGFQNSPRRRPRAAIERSVFVGAFLLVAATSLLGDEGVRWNRDVRPILSDKCFKCHGPDSAKRVSKFRLDDRASATSDLGGRRAIAPGDPGASELVRRITESDPDERMPPRDSGLELTKSQVETLRRWIAEGATYEKHWSLIPPRRPEPPAVRDAAWPLNPIDRFVLARLESENLRPSPEAAKETLIRRLSLDLTGLPPALDEVDAFLADDAPGAYERLVDRLLASPRYGERMAVDWLDLARYADTNGYQGDLTRTMWHWRDWLVRALNANLPLDRFTIDCIAGDLLPDATQDERIATGFHRNHMLNGEGGRIPEESRVEYVMDRVETTATVWLGLTLQCSRCHDHKYDPFLQRDYYGLFAVFNNVPESGSVDAGGNASPVIRLATPEDSARLSELDRSIEEAESRLQNPDPEVDAAQSEWEKQQAPIDVTLSPWNAAGPFQAQNFDEAFETAFGPEPSDSSGAAKAGGAGNAAIEWTEHAEWEDGKPHDLPGASCATYLRRVVTPSRATPATLSLGSDDAIKVWVNGVEAHSKKLVRGVAPDQDRVTASLHAGDNEVLLKIVNGSGGYGFYFKLLAAGAPKDVVAIAVKLPAERDEKESRRIRDYYRRSVSPVLKPFAERVESARSARKEAEGRIPVTMVMEEMAKPRDAFILARGQYDRPGAKVEPGVPAALPPLAAGEPKNRLGLARWLVSPENPLTARVAVNRAWQSFFGTGLVKTAEDFGSQGEPPSHPELLDWLATELAHSWDVKALHRSIVTSSTYRQSSRVPPELLERDPDNRLLARGPRYRLSSHGLRDQALFVSGLLVEKLGGPPVKPYQPPGVWEELTFGQITYSQDRGEALHRRSLYTFWRRSVGPTFLFDASARQVCTVRQARTNTPLHSLVLLNDVTYVEAARAFAERALARRHASDRDRLAWAFRTATARHATDSELDVLERSLQRRRAEVAADLQSADRLNTVGEAPRREGIDAVELAAFSGVTAVILNLDETLTRE